MYSTREGRLNSRELYLYYWNDDFLAIGVLVPHPLSLQFRVAGGQSLSNVWAVSYPEALLLPCEFLAIPGANCHRQEWHLAGTLVAPTAICFSASPLPHFYRSQRPPFLETLELRWVVLKVAPSHRELVCSLLQGQQESVLVEHEVIDARQPTEPSLRLGL